ncbi:MAG: MFS transporter [Candidatus Limnocylindria bacterium]
MSLQTAGSAGWLALLCANRVATALMFMTYAATLPTLVDAWGMTGAQAGSIAGALNVTFGASVVASSWLADRVGARRMLLVFAWLAAASALALAIFARSYPTGLAFVAVMGLTQGGSYGPAMMLIADHVPANRRGMAMGWLLAAASLGYAGSLAVSAIAMGVADYQLAFLGTAVGPVAGACIATFVLRRTPNVVTRPAAPPTRRPSRRRRWPAALLTAGYSGHAWELLGMWAWMPAFLVFATASPNAGAAVGGGLLIAIALHLSGVVASATMGTASDRIGRRRVLIALGAAGAGCSFAAGWTIGAPVGVLVVFVLIYGFAALGDSAVLSTAMTEAVAPGRLGSALAIRSLLGFGAGAVAPVAFGAVLGDPDPGGHGSWGLAFAVLGIGGLVATVSALLLPSGEPGQS